MRESLFAPQSYPKMSSTHSTRPYTASRKKPCRKISEVNLNIPPLFYVSIEARRPRCTVTTTNRESRRRSPEFQREENNRRPRCGDNGVPALADNRGRYQLDLVG